MPHTLGPLPKHGSIVQQYYLDSFGHRRPFDPALALSDALAYQSYDVFAPFLHNRFLIRLLWHHHDNLFVPFRHPLSLSSSILIIELFLRDADRIPR